jgi:hypothetical protein
MPAPRCAVVSARQHLKVVNATDRGKGRTITVTFGGFDPRKVPAGQATTFARPFGTYLAKGVHFVAISGFAGHTEVWLR